MAHSRIDDLRRRVEADPASIAFAQLAEEYRRAGQTDEAVRVCREGLTRHPGYLSARVTLGRALLDLGQLDDARTELQFVTYEAPENLAAVRGLAEIAHREGDLPVALEYFQRALTLARHDPELEEIVQQLSRQVGAEAGPANGLSFEEAHQELLSAAERVPLVAPTAPAESAEAVSPTGSTAPFDFDTLVAALGTPAAPPVVEAVVSGATPPTFALPDLPADAGDDDPFAALEAELRAQGDLAPEEFEAQVEAITEIAAAPEGEADVASSDSDAWALPEPAAELPDDGEAPWLSSRRAESVESVEAAPTAPWDLSGTAMPPPLGTSAAAEPETGTSRAAEDAEPGAPAVETAAPVEAASPFAIAWLEEPAAGSVRDALEPAEEVEAPADVEVSAVTQTASSSPVSAEEPAGAESAGRPPEIQEVPAMPADEPLVVPEFPPAADPVLTGVEDVLETMAADEVAGTPAESQSVPSPDESPAVEPPPATAAPETVEAVQEARAADVAAPGAVPSGDTDDVLGDLEDWLATLQDGSATQ